MVTFEYIRRAVYSMLVFAELHHIVPEYFVMGITERNILFSIYNIEDKSSQMFLMDIPVEYAEKVNHISLIGHSKFTALPYQIILENNKVKAERL